MNISFPIRCSFLFSLVLFACCFSLNVSSCINVFVNEGCIHCSYAVSVLVFLDKSSAIISIFAFTPTQSFNVSSEWLIMRWWYRFGSNEFFFFTEPQFSYAVLHFLCISLYLCQLLIGTFLLIEGSIEIVVFQKLTSEL